MEKSKVEFVYKNISSLNKISIVNKKIFRILPYICVPSLAIGGIAVFLKERRIYGGHKKKKNPCKILLGKSA